MEPLLQTITALSGPKTTILVWYWIVLVLIFSSRTFSLKHLFISDSFLKLGYEIRSTNVHEQMLQMWRRNFDVKIVPQSKVCLVFYANSLL